jgi:O-antigen ligase
MLIPFLLFVPIFFMLDGTIFADPANRYDTLGDLRRLPIPISVFACYGGIVLLGQYQRARFSLALIFFFFIAMLISAILVTESAPWAEKPKLILLIQFVLPVFALVLGQQYFAQQPREWQRAFLYVLVIVVPAQLIATWIRGKYTLSPYLYFFSIHQHLQYVPAIFVCCYIIALYSLWQPCRKLLLLLAPMMGIYIVSSASLLSVVLLFVAVPIFAVQRWITDRDRGAVLLAALTFAGAGFYFQFGKELLNLSYRGGKSGFQSEQIMTSVGDRMEIWHRYGEGITESAKTILLGHAEAPPRTQFPGAHNYYLDFIYNFGLIPLLPLFAGIAYTIALIARNWKDILKDASLLGLCGAVVFLLLPDNLLKVGMRQPYPGIMTFFLWGMLLSSLLALKEKAQSPRFAAAPAVALTR